MSDITVGELGRAGRNVTFPDGRKAAVHIGTYNGQPNTVAITYANGAKVTASNDKDQYAKPAEGQAGMRLEGNPPPDPKVTAADLKAVLESNNVINQAIKDMKVDDAKGFVEGAKAMAAKISPDKSAIMQPKANPGMKM